jgi:hypothetical protein
MVELRQICALHRQVVDDILAAMIPKIILHSTSSLPRSLRRMPIPALMSSAIAFWALTLTGCAFGPDEPGGVSLPRSEAHVASSHQSLVGKDGGFTVMAANTVLNQYSRITADVAVGATTVTVNNIMDLTSAQFGALEPGDLVMLYQAQGATINATDTVAYGDVTAINNAGRYEFVSVTAIAGNVLTLDMSCGGLKHAYTAAGGAQVVRVPQLTSLTINTGASLGGTAWDGQRGGVVAVHVTGATTVNGTGAIDATGIGFRGGATDNAASANDIVSYRGTVAANGAEKGEGIAGFQTAYDALGGRFGRGAPANGGGGGNGHNAGGGGGSNGKALTGFTAWTGAGVMDPNMSWLMAWALDPAYIANGNALTTSLGGGRGGYTYSANNANALMQGPNNDGAWAGDGRNSTGGLGGRPLDNDPTAGRVFLGGGGGAGDGNNGGAGSGGRGGGLIFILSDSVTGDGAIRSNGVNGTNTSAMGNDAPGGGGAGGTILVQSATLGTMLTISANGGLGGNQMITGNEAEGPGGGGSGGFIATSGGVVTPTVNGGNNGTTNSGAVTEFIANGATRGAAGNAGMLNGLATCIDTMTPDTTIPTTEPNPTNDPTGDFVFASNEAGATFECRIDGGAWGPCPANYMTLPLPDGMHTIEVRAIDPVGNVDPTPATYTWEVDTMPPDTTIVVSEPTPTTDPTGDFVFGSNEMNVTYECSIDGGAFVPCPEMFSTQSLPDGTHTIEVRATDAAGNVDPTPASYTWEVNTGGLDNDGDGLTNAQEGMLGTDPNDADSDDDGVLDGDEPLASGDFDGDGKINALDADSDNDGILDGTELGKDCSNADTDMNVCVPDADMGATVTDPLDADTDNGTVPDGQEDSNHNGQIDPGEKDPNVAMDDVAPPDSDGDGLSDAEEVVIGTNPNDADSDDDGVSDGQEQLPGADSDGDGNPNALDTDSDNDGILDGTETGTDCMGTGTNQNVCVPDADMGLTTTDPLDPDTDNGGIPDGQEDANHNGTIDSGEGDPNNPADDIAPPDGDGDGLTDTEEGTIGTNPMDADSDDDGILDGQEPSYNVDSDSDGTINALDNDSDNDGILDGTELGTNCMGAGTDTKLCVPDADNADTVTDPLNPDTDKGGISDGVEDGNHNGTIDNGEGDPNDAKDDIVPTSSSSSSSSGGGGAGGAGGEGGRVEPIIISGGGILCTAQPSAPTSQWGAIIAMLGAIALRLRRRRS